MPPHGIAVKTDLHQTVDGGTSKEDRKSTPILGASNRSSWITGNGTLKVIEDTTCATKC